MKVVYTKTIIEKMDDEILQSSRLDKKIEKFILSIDEWEELYNRLKHICVYLNDESSKSEEGYKTIYRGIPIYVE